MSTDSVEKSGNINVLKPVKGKKFKLVLKSGGNPGYKILLPYNAETTEIKAAEILKRVLDSGTGADFEIEYERVMKVPDGLPVFSIGNTVLYQDSDLSPGIDLKMDGYSITESNGNIFLVGGSKRGAISAVIALVEEDLGSRFYNVDNGLSVAEIPDEIDIVLREYSPGFILRTMFQSESFDKDFQLFNRVGASREKFEYVPGCWGGSSNLPEKYFIHTFQNLLSNEEYFDEHPEYFALIDGERRKQGHGDILGGIGGGQLCLTNPDVRKIVTRNVLAELEIYHSYGLFDISENDVVKNSFCQCDRCRKMKEKEGSDSGALIDFINEIASEVSKHYPEVRITTLAYVESSKPPKNIRPNKNVIIRLANKSGLYPYPIVYARETGEFYSNFKAWIDAGAQLFIWEYAANYLSWLLPRPNLKVIENDIDLYAENGVYGLFLQSSHYGPGENQGKLRAWVYSKKMWDPSRRIEDLIRDFNYGYFGKAAVYMQEYSDLLNREWELFHTANTDVKNTFVFSESFYKRAAAIFQKALAQVSDSPAILSKIEYEFINILFYRLQEIKPKGDDETAEYKKDLERFKSLTDKYHVVSISENKVKVKDRIAEWENEL